MCSSRNMRPRGFVVLSVVLLAFTWAVCGGMAWAEPIGGLVGVEKAFPDIYTGFVGVTYTADTTAGTGSFIASGWPALYSISDDTGLDLNIMCGAGQGFSLDATLDTTASVPMSVCDGTFTISGQLWDADFTMMYYDGTLLAAEIQEFGYSIDSSLDPNTTIFDFRFTVTSGYLADDYGGIGGQGGIILVPESDFLDTYFTGSLESDFTFMCPCFGTNGTADTFAVPEPSSAALTLVIMAVGLASFVMRRSWMRGAEC